MSVGECVEPDDVTDLDYCFSFNQKIMTQTVRDVSTIIPSEDLNRPKPMYKRGIFFDGDDHMEFYWLVSNSSFTLEFWILPYLDSMSDSSLLTVSIDELVFSILSASPSIQYQGTQYNSASQLAQAWTHLVYVIDGQTAKIYINGNNLGGDTFDFDNSYYEYEDKTHVIGESYIGFIQSICIKQRVISSW